MTVCNRLIRHGLVHRDNAHRLIMVEHPANLKALILADKLKP